MTRVEKCSEAMDAAIEDLSSPLRSDSGTLNGKGTTPGLVEPFFFLALGE